MPMLISMTRREPVMAGGLLAAALIFLTEVLGLPVNETVETGLQSGLAALGSLIALWKVRQPGPPTVVIGGLVSALFVALAAVGLPASDEVIGAVQTLAPVVVGWFYTRERVTPEVGPEGTAG